jgi:NADPH:quinone reductase
MKAAFIEEIGSPDVIKVGDLPDPKLAVDHVLVKVDAVSVNPIDTYIRKGSYNAGIIFPFIIGRDMVGTVAQTKPDTEQFSVGDRVWCNNQGYSGRQGTFAEFISVHKDLLYRLPPEVDALNAVASVHSALTAVVGLRGRAGLRRGETLFINGGSGNVGTSAIQLARSIGARVESCCDRRFRGQGKTLHRERC